ncbi:putative bifunctional diguanylate cyclase/phosphodiesterase [Desulfovibrio ferrophilus]|uniref:Diguanylate cyclase/phosphodiesterase with PAS/PAC sensor(S) n=1 Tax=Desulfovibrio ferrophilus TaxID=241368 RepID=A0A2Z6AVA9_9BACT|nr:GGDEF domain-containing phosphodiesterase [Desulfovibrio ferrophilus]BBD07167.1 diguanylate cyclase/phosphodiesterase with PAS/PAC sensor(S) [Desulfovibrio ferrophilus]
MPTDTSYLASVLSRLGYCSDTFASLPLMSLDDLFETSCDIVGSVLDCDLVLMHFDDKECLSKTYVKRFDPAPLADPSVDGDIAEHLSNRLRAHSRVDLDVESIVQAVAAVPTTHTDGGRIRGAPLNVCSDDGRRHTGFILASPRTLKIDEATFDMLLEIMSGLVAGAVSKCLTTVGLLRANRQLASEITERTKAEQAAQESEDLRHIVAEHNLDWVYWKDHLGKVLYVNPACETISGMTPQQFLNAPEAFEMCIHCDDITNWRQYNKHTPTGCHAVDFRIFRPDGHMRWVCQTNCTIRDKDGQDLGIRCSLQDITDRKIREMRHEAESLHDPLTGLANRTLCLNRIAHSIQRAKRNENYHYAVIFIDLDRFKVINDCLGHATGDIVLSEVAQRLLRCIRGVDTAARIGGDEFMLLLEDLESPRQAIQIVKRVRDIMREPFRLSTREVTVTASLGIVLSPCTCEHPEDLMRNSNIAMHHAKNKGRNRFKVFTPKMFERTIRRMSLENDMRRAIFREEYFLEFQPIVTLHDSRLTGFEALVRWKHPDRGLVGPAEFIPMAEESGLIIDLGHWVLEEACRTMVAWQKTHPAARNLTMSVNISGKQFSQSDLVDCIKGVLKKTGMPARNLKLEITETMIMQDAKSSIEKLNRLRKLGITFSIDDFGTGYSSMSYLQQFPIESLKIDFSFIRNMKTSQENVEIVKIIIQLAHSLGLDVVAEGVESEWHQATLAKLRCEFGQGFYFAQPLSAYRAEQAICAPQQALAAHSIAQPPLLPVPAARCDLRGPQSPKQV